MVSVCLPSDALLQHWPSFLGFSYLGRGVSLQGCFSKVQPLLLTLDEGYLLTAAIPDLQHGIAPLGPPVPRGDTYRLKVKGWKKIFHANRDQKKAGVAITISDKIDFKIKTVIWDKERHYIMIKWSIQEEDITIINIYALNIGAPYYIRQMLITIKGETV